MRRLLHSRSFLIRLVSVFCVLILLTTLSAGVPAYLLTRAQLEQQTWSSVENARQATLSLLLAEQTRLTSQVRLFAERSTLHKLMLAYTPAELSRYSQAFQDQNNLDILFLCQGNRPLEDTTPFPCPQPASPSFELVTNRPAIVVRQPIFDAPTGRQLGTAVAGRWLDHAFLRQLALNTGATQTILGLDGVRLSSSLAYKADISTPAPLDVVQPVSRQTLQMDGRPYYAAYTPLTSSSEQTALVSEVALPVDGLFAATNQALLVLAASTGLVAVFGALLGLGYVRQLTAPLEHLTRVAERISGGDLVTPIPSFTDPAEVSTLAEALQKSQSSMLQAIKERSQARDWLNTLVQSVAEGVVTFDTEGKITFFSQGAEMLTGWSSGEAQGRHINEVFPLSGENDASFFDQLPPRGEKRQISLLNRAGQEVILATTRSRLVPPGGDTPQVALVLRDVTEEEALRHLRSYFLANISHEFRTPLSTLNASIELLLSEAEELSTAEMRELLKPTALSLRGLQTLIDNLLESSSIEAGRFIIRNQPTDMNEVIQSALQLVQPLLERRNQTVSLEEPARLPHITADPARLTQVLVNLLSNASKYSPIGQPVDLRLEQIEAMLRVSVADRGPGIPPAERINLFRRFVRLDAHDREQYGVGLGLFVVKNAIEAHGGRVGVDDRLGGGSVFWFELPL